MPSPEENAHQESSEAASLTWGGVQTGLRDGLGYALGTLPFGAAFGAAAVAGGLSPLEATLMSLAMLAGSAQFAALGIWSSPPAFLALFVTTFAVNARHIVMGAALHPHAKGLPRWKLYLLAAGMTDTSWALTVQRMLKGKRDFGFLGGSGFTQWITWPGGTAIGAILGASGIDPKTWGIDMVISGMFTLTVIGLWRGKQDVLPWIAAVATALLGLFWLPGNAYLLLGGFAAGSVGLFTAPKPEAAT